MDFRSGGFGRNRDQVRLDLTPLIDCIFQLLVFFMLTASFANTPALGVDLPKASAKAAAKPEKDIVVSVTRKGLFLINGRTVGASSLVKLFSTEYRKNARARILVRADIKAYHGDVVRVMDVAKAVGFQRLAIATQPRASGNP